MKLFFTNFKSELRGLFASGPGTLYFLFQSILIGLSFYSVLGGSGGAVASNAGAAPEQAAPVESLFAPVFRLSYYYFALFLPFVFARLMSPRKDYIAISAIYRMSGAGRIFSPRLSAGLVYLAASHSLVFPSVLYWSMLRGEAGAAEVLALGLGCFSYGVLVLSVSLFCSSFTVKRFSATYASVIILFLPYLFYFIVNHAGPIFFMATVPAPIMPMFLEHGVSSTKDLLSVLDLSLILILFSYFRTGPDTLRILPVAVTVLAIACISAAAANPDLFGVPDIAFSAAGRGLPPSISEWERQDILVIYLGVIPLLLGFGVFARTIRFSLKNPGRKKIVTSVGSWLVIIASLALIQDFYIKNQKLKLFPGFGDILPGSISGLINEHYGRGAGMTAIQNNEDRETGNAVVYKGGALQAGDDNRHLDRFFKRLSELDKGRRDVVRIVHYGDSLIWADCFSKTVKRRFQKDFGEGGRGLVPPVETSATVLQDYFNRTKAEGFSLYMIKHRFRRNDGFHIRPELNPMVGFTGEGICAVSPKSEIRLAVQDGFNRWKRVQVFMRPGKHDNPGGAGYTVNLDYGAGKASKIISIEPDSTAAATFDIPPADSVAVTVGGPNGERPVVDAVNLETGRGIAYSTIVRMGIHMSWMNAIPERNLKVLRTFNPDLMIFQFGINEAASLGAFPEFTEDTLRSQMREWLVKVKQLLPDTDVLLIGPPERLQVYQGSLVPMKETLVVRRVQREEAARAGMAFFDTYEQLGGAGQMLKMVNSGMAMNDYTHFTFKGGDFAAEGFYDSLMSSYQQKGSRPGPELHAAEDTGIRFNSAAYLCFLAIVVAAGLILGAKPRYRFAFFIAASYYFYATWKVWPLFCLAATTITDFSMARLIKRARDRGGKGSAYLALSLVINLGILFVLKYFDFFSGLISEGLNAAGFPIQAPLLNILLPAGISFYTLQSLSYTIDVWRGKIEPEKSFVRYAHYASFFTQLLAGPIVKAREFLPALKDAACHFTVTRQQAATALFLILLGLAKKAGADWLGGTIVDRVFDSPHMFLPLETLTAVYAYGLQIYGDFSGYTDIAIGSAMLLGFNLTENFRRPYASASVSEFWQRWHISLGSWLRDYLYVGLGGNRKRVLFNIGITMFVCGLWHGAAIPFAVWGLYHGFFLILERVFGLNKPRQGNPLIRAVRVLITLHIVLFGWILFRSGSWTAFTGILSSLAKLVPGAPNVGIVLAAVIAACYALHYTPASWKGRLALQWTRMPATLQGFAASCVTVMLYNFSALQAKPFIYFQF